MSPDSIQSRRLEFQYRKDGIPTASPPAPKHWFPRVPSILCMQHRNPILGYSKAPWGLSVLSRVTGIFTGTTISPGGLLRQCPNHYAFHAGQNLPDKEFRYLRTVIVTAAVHWGFDSMLAHLLLTIQHRAGVSSYTSSFDLAQTCVLVNSCLGRFSAAPSLEHPFSRSYGVILPSSLTMLLPPALGFSPHPPVSVYGTGTSNTIAAFLDTSSTCFATLVRSTSRPRVDRRFCLSVLCCACTGLSFSGSCFPHVSPHF